MIKRWIEEDTIREAIVSAYTEGKGYLFGIFFGWRASRCGKSCYCLSRKDWKEIDILIKYYEKKCLTK